MQHAHMTWLGVVTFQHRRLELVQNELQYKGVNIRPDFTLGAVDEDNKRLSCYLFRNPIVGLGTRGGVVVKALGYKPAGLGFDSRRCLWNFSVT